MKIRPFNFSDSEYETILELRNIIQPDNPSSVAIWQHNDQNRNPDVVFQRFVVEMDGELMAYGQVEETAVSNRTFRIDIQIHPAYQAGNLTGRLYTHLLDSLQSHSPTRLLTQIRENETMKLYWLRQHGFEQGRRYPISHLELARFDPAPYADLLARVAAGGIMIVPLAQLVQGEPDWQRQVYELDYILMRDVPTTEPYVKRPFPQFVVEEFEHPNFWLEGWFIARDGRQNVGMTGLVKIGGQTERLATAITGVVRNQRRLGIATALKVVSLQQAQQLGARIIKTDNEENNPMYLINRRLGFMPQPAILDFIHQSGKGINYNP